MEATIGFIIGTIQEVVNRSRRTAFRSEDQIQGFFEGRGGRTLPTGLEYIAECPTTAKYVRKAGYLEQSDTGRRGRIDAVIRSTYRDIAGIEIQYPRGQGIRSRDLFISHIRNDVTKLEDHDGLLERYLLLFMYNDPPDNLSLKQLDLGTHSVRMTCIRLAKKSDAKGKTPVMKIESIPEGWISCSDSGEIRSA